VVPRDVFSYTTSLLVLVRSFPTCTASRALNTLAGYEHTRTWLADVREHADPQLSCILVGNKLDLVENEPEDAGADVSTPAPTLAYGNGKKRAVPRAEAAAWAESEGLLFVEASAKNGENVEKAFVDACADVLRKVRAGAFDDGRVSIFPAIQSQKSDPLCRAKA
jgi:Ras-related protein Rab-2A